MVHATGQFWDGIYRRQGHTGYSDPRLLAYDQPVRLTTLRRLLSRLFRRELHGRAVLDIGCGTGDIVALLKSMGARVRGIDISADVAAFARRRFAGESDVVIDAVPLLNANLPAAAYDLVTSVTVLQHVVDHDDLVTVLRGLWRALKPGGYLVALELAPPIREPASVATGDVIYLQHRPAELWRFAFEEAGFACVRESALPELGIALQRGLTNLLNRRVPESADQAPTGNSSTAAPRLTIKRRALRSGLSLMRRSIYVAATPFDRWLGAPLPASHHRHYRIFVLKKAA